MSDTLCTAKSDLIKNHITFRFKLQKLRKKLCKNMDNTFKKLNFKNQKEVIVLFSPESFEKNIESIIAETSVIRSLDGVAEVMFAMVFVTQQIEIDTVIPKIAPMLKGDAVLWMCYPKGTSKKFKCDFNRDTGWAVMGPYELEPVRMVAIDEDWSALRFKKVDYIKTMKRDSLGALSEKGRQKAEQK